MFLTCLRAVTSQICRVASRAPWFLGSSSFQQAECCCVVLRGRADRSQCQEWSLGSSTLIWHRQRQPGMCCRCRRPSTLFCCCILDMSARGWSSCDFLSGPSRPEQCLNNRLIIIITSMHRYEIIKNVTMDLKRTDNLYDRGTELFLWKEDGLCVEMIRINKGQSGVECCCFPQLMLSCEFYETCEPCFCIEVLYSG